MLPKTRIFTVLTFPALLASPILAGPFSFSTGAPTSSIATASRPDGGGLIEIESADDFILGSETSITSALFYGLLPVGTPLSNVTQVIAEIYRVFPFDSTDPPSGHVPTRVNSPSDVAFDSRDSGASTLSFNVSLLSPSFTALNSVVNGIHPLPNPTTGGEGSVTGEEVLISANLIPGIDLPAGHYFFVPQVLLSSGTFLWLSAARPNVTDPFAPDLQAWIRNADLDPDWLRIGTDIVGGNTEHPAPTFNMAFELDGTSVPEPSSVIFVLAGLSLAGVGLRRRRSWPQIR